MSDKNETKPSVDDIIKSILPSPKHGDRISVADVQAAMLRLMSDKAV